MKRIVFSGYLADMYPDGIEVHGDSPAECISALGMFPGFRQEDEVRHTVVLPDFGSKDAIYARTDADTIRMDPIIVGASGKNGNWAMVIIGIILIYTGYGAGYGSQMVMGGTMTASQATMMGVMMVMNGVIALTMTQPESTADNAEEKSKYLAANKNTTKIGTRIALLFGRRRVWGHILSFNVTATTLPPPPLVGSGIDGGFEYGTDGYFPYVPPG